MKKSLLFLLCCFISNVVFRQWQQSVGTAGLNIQSLFNNGIYDFAGGQTGAYLSTDKSASYTLSNSGNDAVGPWEAGLRARPLVAYS